MPREVFILNKNLDAISALIILEDYFKTKFTLCQNINFMLEVVSLRDSKTVEPIVVEINIVKIAS